jgi:hypothetical protein
VGAPHLFHTPPFPKPLACSLCDFIQDCVVWRIRIYRPSAAAVKQLKKEGQLRRRWLLLVV